MVNPLMKQRDRTYNVKAFLVKKQTEQKNITWNFDEKIIFLCKDLGFETTYVKGGGITKKQKLGKLETIDLEDGQVEIDDKIEYCGEEYIVTKVIFNDIEPQKMLSPLKATGITSIEVRK